MLFKQSLLMCSLDSLICVMLNVFKANDAVEVMERRIMKTKIVVLMLFFLADFLTALELFLEFGRFLEPSSLALGSFILLLFFVSFFIVSFAAFLVVIADFVLVFFEDFIKNTLLSRVAAPFD